MRRLATEEIYDAVFDDEAFDHMLHRMAAAVGARTFAAGWHYRDGGATLFRTSSRWAAEDIDRYNRDFALTEVWNVALLRHAKLNRAMDMANIVSDEEFARSELHNEFFRPLGDDTWRSLALPTWHSNGAGAIAFHRGKSQGGFAPDAVKVLDSYGRHLGRMLALRGELSVKDRAIDSYEALTAALGQAVLLVDASLTMRHGNAAAEDLLREGLGLRLRRRALCCSHPADDRRLKETVARALSPVSPEPGALAVRRSRGPQLLLSILAAPRQRDMALIVVSDPARRDATLGDRLRALFRLSEAESCLAVMLADGLTLAEIAELRGVSLATVRVQVKSTMAKLDCGRQAEIVAIVKSLPELNWRSSE